MLGGGTVAYFKNCSSEGDFFFSSRLNLKFYMRGLIETLNPRSFLLDVEFNLTTQRASDLHSYGLENVSVFKDLFTLSDPLSC